MRLTTLKSIGLLLVCLILISCGGAAPSSSSPSAPPAQPELPPNLGIKPIFTSLTFSPSLVLNASWTFDDPGAIANFDEYRLEIVGPIRTDYVTLSNSYNTHSATLQPGDYLKQGLGTYQFRLSAKTLAEVTYRTAVTLGSYTYAPVTKLPTLTLTLEDINAKGIIRVGNQVYISKTSATNGDILIYNNNSGAPLTYSNSNLTHVSGTSSAYGLSSELPTELWAAEKGTNAANNRVTLYYNLTTTPVKVDFSFSSFSNVESVLIHSNILYVSDNQGMSGSTVRTYPYDVSTHTLGSESTTYTDSFTYISDIKAGTIGSSTFVFVCDETGNKVSIFNRGTGGTPIQTLTGAESGLNFNRPKSIALDFSPTIKRIYVLDRNNNRILIYKYNSGTGLFAFETLFGTEGMDSGEFVLPNVLSIDASRRLFVLQEGSTELGLNDRLQIFQLP